MKVAQFPETSREWHWRVLMLAWPIILSNLSVPLVGIVDTAVVGQLSDARYIGAVAIGATIFSSVFWVFGFLRMGTTGFVSQAAGANNSQEISFSLLRALSIAVFLGVLLILLQTPLAWLSLSLMGAAEGLNSLVESYFSIRMSSAPAVFINYCILGALIGLQRMRQALLLQLLLNGTNLLLDMVFVLQFGMASDGVALASVISEYLAAAAGLWVLRPYLRAKLLRENMLLNKLYSAAAIRALFEVNGNLFLRTLFLTSAFFFFTAQGAQFGVLVLAANAILINLLQTLAYGLDGFAHAAEALSGSAYGAKNKTAFRQAVRVSSFWALIMAALLTVTYAASTGWIIERMTVNAEVIELAYQYRGWIIASPLLVVWSYQLDGIFIGATQTAVMRNTVMISLIIYIVLAYTMMPLAGNHGLWLSLMVFMVLRGVTLALAYPKLLLSFNN
ncbi:MAG: MATE family efflux transporter [Proteobacteria bacterium]|nr:MAG: MATE family efflux transporter [Pseudomonadota bacterium]